MSEPLAAGPDGPDAPRLALRSPVEVLLWILLTRLMALVMPTRVAGAGTRPDDALDADHDPDDDAGRSPTAAVDAGRAARVAASRRRDVPDDDRAADAPAGTRDPSARTTRTVAVTAGAAVAAGAAAFAAGRRRGAR